uniref:C-factor-like n=1 Tax=Naja naja TaxID=35670 RepID=A0A8C7E4H1_NAJNA
MLEAEAADPEEMAQAADFSVFSVLVTGSNRGIGLGLVKRFLELPCPPKWVFATSRDMEGEKSKEVRELSCKHPNLVVLQLDVTNLKSIQAALKGVEKCVGEGGLTLLINNAGIWVYSDMETENAKDMMRVYSVNSIGPLQISQAFLPLLKKAARRSPRQGLSSSKAAIINISSNAGSMELVAYWNVGSSIAYRCSKAALNMLTKCQSLEYAANGIMSISIHPGSVETFPNPVEVKELVCRNPNLVLLQLDVTILESIQAVLKEVEKCVGDDGLTLLINNAGLWFFENLENENAKDMQTLYSVKPLAHCK